MKMELPKVTILLLCYIGLSNSSMVTITQEWVQNSGWKVRCLWNLPESDSLQSTRLYKNGEQFCIYRPEVFGPSKHEYVRAVGWQIDCRETSSRGVTGECVVATDLYDPPHKLNFTCEVSGERPTFRMESQYITVSPFVPPTDAVIAVANLDSESNRVTLNCSASGLPQPSLIWTIGGQKVPSEFLRSTWNYSTKIYDTWSTVSYSWVQTGLSATCSPQVHHEGRTVEGATAQYNRTSGIQSMHSLIFVIVLYLLLS